MSDAEKPREPVTDADLIRLLCEIKRLALSKYPFMREDGALDAILCIRLGEIAGLCSITVEDYRARNPDARH